MNLLDRFFLWCDIQQIKSAQNRDMIVVHLNRELLLIPGTIQAQRVMETQFAGKRYRKTWCGGYIIPEDSWKKEYDALHHGPCPMAVWI